MDPLTAGITYTAASGGAGAAGGGAAAAALSNPFTAALLAIAAGTAYGVSPKFRNKTNKFIKGGYESFTNPFQHFGDGSDKDKFGKVLNGEMDLTGLVGSMNPMSGANLLDKVRGSNPSQQQNQQKQNQQNGNSGNPGGGIFGAIGSGTPLPSPIAGLNPVLPRPEITPDMGTPQQVPFGAGPAPFQQNPNINPTAFANLLKQGMRRFQ